MSDEPLSVRVESAIPVGRGLGSSAAVLTALTAAVWRHQGIPDDHRALFEFVADAEGHPDNAAAAVYGSLAYSGPGGIRRLDLHPSWRVVVAVPGVVLSTPEARAALPDSVSFGVAARTASRLVRLVEGLRTGDVGLLSNIGPDELHEPHRIALRPVIGDMLASARAAGAPFAAVSGSGPSVIALVTDNEYEPVRAALTDVGSVDVISPAVAVTGVS